MSTHCLTNLFCRKRFKLIRAWRILHFPASAGNCAQFFQSYRIDSLAWQGTTGMLFRMPRCRHVIGSDPIEQAKHVNGCDM